MFRTAPGEARALIEDWINRPTLRELVEADGGAWPEGDLEHIVAELAEFSKVWDYRSGKSRLMFHEDQDEPDPHEELTYRAAKELGLMNPVPPSQDEYDYMLILGGLATGVEPRVKYAAKLIEDGLKIRKQVAGLGSFRELQEKELPISRRYAPEGLYEIDHLIAMMAELFQTAETWWCTGTGDPSIDPRTSGLLCNIEHVTQEDGLVDFAAYAAASSAPEVRPANTADTYDVFAGKNSVGVGETALLVTSAIYMPYQHFDAVNVLALGHGLTCETVGLMAPGSKRHSASAYRQEIRSAAKSSCSFDLSVNAPHIPLRGAAFESANPRKSTEN